MPRDDLKRVGQDLLKTLRDLGLEGTALEALAVTSWPRVAGERIAAATRAAGMRDRVLEVHTRSSAWTQELTFHKERILGLFSKELGRGVVEDIRFKTTTLHPEATEVAPPQWTPAPGELEEVPLSEEALRDVEQAAEHNDPEIRGLIRRALTHERRLAEWQRRNGFRPCERCGALCEPPLRFCPMCGAGGVRPNR